MPFFCQILSPFAHLPKLEKVDFRIMLHRASKLDQSIAALFLALRPEIFGIGSPMKIRKLDIKVDKYHHEWKFQKKSPTNIVSNFFIPCKLEICLIQ